MIMSNPTDTPIDDGLSEQSPEGNTNIAENDQLATFLKSHNVYNDLYQILVDHDFNMDELKNDVEQDEIEEICKDLGLKGLKKARFNKLMRIINEKHPSIEEEKYNSIDDDEDLKAFLKDNNVPESEKLYTILLSEKITFNTLKGMTGHDIDKICDANKIKIGQKIKLKDVIHNHQRKILDKTTKKTKKKHDYEIKIVLIGDSNAGKTALMARYCKNTFNPTMISTCGVDLMFHYLTLGNDSTIRLDIRDTAGQERFQSIAFTYYRGAHAILYCYDVSDKDALDTCDTWRQHIEDHADDDVIVVFVACKCDKKKERQIKQNDVDEIIERKEWKKYDIKYVECSAKTGDNVNSVFRIAADLCVEKGKVKNAKTKGVLSNTQDDHESQQKDNKKKKCCI